MPSLNRQEAIDLSGQIQKLVPYGYTVSYKNNSDQSQGGYVITVRTNGRDGTRDDLIATLNEAGVTIDDTLLNFGVDANVSRERQSSQQRR